MQLAVSRFVSFLFVLAFAVFLVMTFDNVYTDIDPIKALAEAAACKVKDCSRRHAVKQYDRAFDGQQFVFQWDSGSVAVACQRSHVVFGERECTAR